MSGYATPPSDYDRIAFGEPPRQFALYLDEFIDEEQEHAEPLVGSPEEVILPAHGLALLIGKGGRGKTTLLIEACYHWASGIDWLGFPVSRPLHILLIENEGPREMFRLKLQAKLDGWPHEMPGTISIHTMEWGSFRLTEREHADALRGAIEQRSVDLVIGDPLDSLGIEGVGSPENTREFVQLMAYCGLGRTVAFMLLHHPRKEQTADELDEAAGAWGGKPDTMMRLTRLDGNKARLSFPKLRWSRLGSRPAYLLDFDPESQSYTVAGQEAANGEIDRDLAEEMRALLADGQPRILREICASTANGGIGANHDHAKAALEDRADLFEIITGEACRQYGRRKSATLYALTENGASPTSAVTPADPLQPASLLDSYGSSATSAVTTAAPDETGRVTAPASASQGEEAERRNALPPEPILSAQDQAEAERIAAQYDSDIPF